jgi:NAD(P) transhydrogenase subunit alpha
MTTVFVPKETRPGETRVALSPETAKRFVQAKVELVVEPGAGLAAGFSDAAFAQAGAKTGEAWASDVVLKVAPPTLAEARKLKSGAVLVSFLNPARELELVGALRHGGVTALAMELVPRISRAQAMDALSSQATVAGYKAVLLGACELVKMCPLLMTAAGTVPPAKVVVFGAGVAGLMAIATARRLGCVVEATDVRMAAKEQVESLGGRFITVPGAADMEGSGGYAKEQSEDFLRRQREEVAKRVAEADLVITTAQIPGKKAPVLVNAEMVRSMRAGAVIVDMAVESGGNCELSVLGQTVEREGIKIVGLANLPASVPQNASELYARNLLALLKLMLDKEGKLTIDWNDEVLAGCRLTHAGEVTHAPTAQALATGAAR